MKPSSLKIRACNQRNDKETTKKTGVTSKAMLASFGILTDKIHEKRIRKKRKKNI